MDDTNEHDRQLPFDRGAARRRPLKAALGALFVVALLAVAWWLWDRARGPGDDGTLTAAEQLELNRTALAATENLEAAEADAAWTRLADSLAADAPQTLRRSVALNLALNRLLLVDELVTRANNANLTAEERQAARTRLPEAIAAARQAIENYREEEAEPLTEFWLESRLAIQEATLLPGAMASSVRRETFEQLASAIDAATADPDSGPPGLVLTGPFVRSIEALEDPLKGLPEPIARTSADRLATLSDRYPDNLFLALAAAQAMVSLHANHETASPEAWQERAASLVERTWELARVIEPMLAPAVSALDLTPRQLVDEVLDAIERGDLATADQRLTLWFNVLNPTQLVKTDRRRAAPHPLDRLEFESLRQFAAAAASEDPLKRPEVAIEFTPTPVSDTAEVRRLMPLDYDLDLDADLVGIAGANRLMLWENGDGGAWSEVTSLELDFEPTGMVAADLFMVDISDPARVRAAAPADGAAAPSQRHDTFRSLVVFGPEGPRIVSVDGRVGRPDAGRLQLVDEPTGLEMLTGVLAVVPGDLEGDGDLDLVVATEEGVLRLLINRGNRTFFEAPEVTVDTGEDEPIAAQITAMAIADLDRDLDLDVVTIDRDSGRVGLLENLLHLQFRHRWLDGIDPVPGAAEVVVSDLDGNVSWDLVIGGSERTDVVYSQTAAAGSWTVEQIVSLPGSARWLAVSDFDNDAWWDVIRSGGGTTALTPLAAPPNGNRLEDPPAESLRSLAVADFDRDGRMDLSYIEDGVPHIALNGTEPVGHFLKVRFRGIDDNAADSGRVNHFAIGSVVELRFGPHYRAQIVTDPLTHFGLDGFTSAASLRVIFPNGLTQTIRDPAVDTLIEEQQSLKGSCPYLYTWDGERFTFVTDCLWAAPLGLQVARGVVAKDRPWEYLKVDGRLVQPRDGAYELRITEELWEIAYIDHVALRAVDHPAEWDIWTNEKVGPAALAEPKLFAFAPDDRVALREAFDTSGDTVTKRLRDRDREFVQGFDRRLRQGLCPPHWIDLDFGSLSDRVDGERPIYLVLTGWILPTDTSLNIQIDQNPALPAVEFPSLWVPDDSTEEGWRKAVPFIGFPGGKTKTIVVEVTDVVDRDDARLRVRTSAQIYWDQAELAWGPAPGGRDENSPALVTHDLPLLSAELAFRGFSRRLAGGPRQPERYDYDAASLSPKWPPLSGPLTRFGDCQPLVKSWDDAMVVMSGGDELRLRFELPPDPLPSGWSRDFILHCVGWDKDADLNTLTGQTIGPLPYRQMGQYPPPPAGVERGSEQVRSINRWHLTREQSFRAFWKRTEPSAAEPFQHSAGSDL